MEPLFTNKSTYTKQYIIEASRGTSSHKLKTIFFISFGLLIFICGLLARNYFSCLFGALFCIFYPLLLFWTVRHSAINRYQQLQQLYNGEAESVISFFEDHLDVHYIRGGSDVVVAYPQIAKVFETKNLYFLMLSTRVGFLLEKQGFEGTASHEFGRFIRARAVGEGQKDLKKRKRKSMLITTAVVIVFITVGFVIGFFGDAINNIFPRTFAYGNYSIKLTNAFDEYDGEWETDDVTVYCAYDTDENLSNDSFVYDTAAAYLQNTAESYEIDSVVTSISDTCAWTEYTESYDGSEYYYYDYVIMSDSNFWFTEFYCLSSESNKYKPLFEKWAQTIKIDNEKR